MKIISEDVKMAWELRQAGVFEDLKNHLIKDPHHIIVPCSDGHQMRDLFWNHLRRLERNDPEPIIHTLALNGGALLIAESSPMNRVFREDLVILHHLKQAITMKGVKTVVLYAHCPCGAAYHQGLTLRQAISLLVESKSRAQACLPGIDVSCYYHIDYGNRRRTYFVNRQNWEQYLDLAKR